MQGLVFTVKEDGCGEVVLAGFGSESKVVKLSGFAGWWGRTVTIEMGWFGRESV